MAYNYKEAVKDAVLERLMDYVSEEDILTAKEENDIDGILWTLSDEMWTDDGITGNGSGSFTFDRTEALKNLDGNLPLLVEACEEYGCTEMLCDNLKTANYEALDVTIRCYLLNDAIYEVVTEWLEEKGA